MNFWEAHTLQGWEDVTKPIQSGLLYGLSSLLIYLAIVIITTPNLKPLVSVSIAIAVNWWIIIGISLGVGIQSFLLSYAKGNSCKINKAREIKTTSGILSVLSSFLSYFVLIPIGCCGTWLYIISFLPGIIGVAWSAVLIKYSTLLAALGIVLMVVSITYTYISIKKEIKLQKDSTQK